MKLTHSSMVTSTVAGARKIQGEVVAARCPSAMSVPRDVFGVCTPKPK